MSSGIDVLAIEEWTGHRDMATTIGYLHYSEALRDADRLSVVLRVPEKLIEQRA